MLAPIPRVKPTPQRLTMQKTTMYALCVAHQELRLAGRRKEALKLITAELYVTNLRDEVRFHLVHHVNLRDLVDQYGLDEQAASGVNTVAAALFNVFNDIASMPDVVDEALSRCKPYIFPDIQ